MINSPHCQGWEVPLGVWSRGYGLGHAGVYVGLCWDMGWVMRGYELLDKSAYGPLDMGYCIVAKWGQSEMGGMSLHSAERIGTEAKCQSRLQW